MSKLKDIASRAGVAESTVSAVINNKSYCYASENTRRRILDTARKLGYRASPLSRGIQGLSTNTIGVVSSLFTVPIATELMGEISRHIWGRDYHTLFGDSYVDPVKKRFFIDEFIARGVDGFVLAGGGCSYEDISRRIDGRVPFVLVKGFKCKDDIGVDEKKGTARATEHLIRHGHERIAYCAHMLSSNREKYCGYEEAVKDAGLPVFAVDLDCYEEDWEGVAKGALELFRNKGVTGFLCSNDFTGACVIKKFTENGVAIPEQAAVIGYDGLTMGELTVPALATLRMPVGDLAREAVEILMYRIDNPDDTGPLMKSIEPQLIKRGSCGCLSY